MASRKQRAGARTRLRPELRALLVTAPLLLSQQFAAAAERTWINSSGGNFSVGSNWSGGAEPGSIDTAVFGGLGSQYSVQVSSDIAVLMTSFEGDDVTLSIGTEATYHTSSLRAGVRSTGGTTRATFAGGRLRASFPTYVGLTSGAGVNGQAFLTLAGAANWVVPEVQIGLVASGVMTASGGSTLQVSGIAAVGSSPQGGTLNVIGGSQVNAGTLLVASGGDGTVSISGFGSGLHAPVIDLSSVGLGTSATLVAAGGTVSTPLLQVGGNQGSAAVSVLGLTQVSATTLSVGRDPLTPPSGTAGPASFALNGGTLDAAIRVTDETSVFDWGSGRIIARAVQLFRGGRMIMRPGGDKVLRTGSFLIDPSLGSTLDVGDNALVLDYQSSSLMPTVFARLSGRQIMTASATAATTVGCVEASDALGLIGSNTALFEGEVVDATTVLARYTYYGDANLNGTVDFDDYVLIDQGYNLGRSGWYNGDFDYSYGIDFDDYVLIDLAYNTQNGTLRRAIDFIDGTDRSPEGMAAPALQKIVEHFERFGTDYATHFLAAVPEPGSVSVAALSAVSAATARRRRRRGRLAVPACQVVHLSHRGMIPSPGNLSRRVPA